MIDVFGLVRRALPRKSADTLPVPPGESYRTVLKRLHDHLAPATYFEIGTFSGETLKLSNCKSIAVDPAFQIKSDVVGRKPSCMMFQCPSDDFFRDHDVSALFGAPIDLAFLDGMHLIEFLLRDFANVEAHCRPNSIIAVHDCVPLDRWMAERDYTKDCQRRSRFGGWWTGDVWKIVPILSKYRPDLTIAVLDAWPTGLLLVTHLDPKSTVLEDQTAAILNDYGAVTLADYGVKRHYEACALVPTRRLDTLAAFQTRFSNG